MFWSEYCCDWALCPTKQYIDGCVWPFIKSVPCNLQYYKWNLATPWLVSSSSCNTCMCILSDHLQFSFTFHFNKRSFLLCSNNAFMSLESSLDKVYTPFRHLSIQLRSTLTIFSPDSPDLILISRHFISFGLNYCEKFDSTILWYLRWHWFFFESHVSVSGWSDIFKQHQSLDVIKIYQYYRNDINMKLNEFLCLYCYYLVQM